jgi:hypothetical protein
MANVSAFAGKLMLDFVLNAQTATRPTAWGVGLSLGVPSSTSGSEIGSASIGGYTRQNASFAAASTPGTCTNATAMTFGPFSNAASITGLQIWNTTTNTVDIGSLLWYGTLTTARTVGVGDSLVVASGALTVTLS